MQLRHHRRRYIHIPRSLGERAADRVATAMGSWRFIIIQSAIVGCWIAANLVAIARHFDPYPFILLNLLFSTQAAYAAPIIMMSQNRQAQKDRVRDDHEAVTVDESHATLQEVYGLSNQIHRLMLAQDDVLARQNEILYMLSEGKADGVSNDRGDPGATADTGPATQTVAVGRVAKPTDLEWHKTQGGEQLS